MKPIGLPFVVGVSGLIVVLGMVPATASAGTFKTYETPYYTIHTDLPVEDIREAQIRITRMAEEYHRRTKGFTGVISDRLPFYIFSRKEDYVAAGGPPDSAGVFMGNRLMATATVNAERTWKIIQHEGFHQFVHAVMGGTIPTWVDEGMAEYFEEAVFTGSGLVSGVVPPDRMLRVKAMILAGRQRPLAEMMRVSRVQWNYEMTMENYDQAWSMVHFLAHANNGRYQNVLNLFLREVSRGRPWEMAWRDSFGANSVGAFEAQWREYWLNLPDDPTAALYAEAAVTTMTNFLARAVSQGQTFDSWDTFVQAAETNALKVDPNDWLPPRLLTQALASRDRFGSWTLDAGSRRRNPSITCTMSDRTTLTGTFSLRKGRVRQVNVRWGKARP